MSGRDIFGKEKVVRGLMGLEMTRFGMRCGFGCMLAMLMRR